MRLLWAIALGAPFARPSDFTTNETAWCRDHIYLPSGGFCPNAPYAGMDSSLAASLVEYFERHHRDERVETTIGDFGAGGGWYSENFNSRPGLRSSPYDYSPQAGTPVVKFDVSKVLGSEVPVFDFVLCLEVGEHIPNEFEDTFLDNLATHARHGIVLSWALPGQGGVGHVNTQPNDYVVARMAERGWVEHPRATAEFRARARFKWFKRTLLAFGSKHDRRLRAAGPGTPRAQKGG